MKRLIMAIACLMTMVIVSAHNTHYPTYTEDGITYVASSLDKNGKFGGWEVLKVDKPNSITIVIPSKVTIDGEEVSVGRIRERAFATCISLDSLIISDGIMIGNCFKTFEGCNELEYLYYSQGWYCGGWNCGDGRGPVTDMTYYGLKCKTLETTDGITEQPFWRTIGCSLEKLIIRDTNRFYSSMDELCPNLKTIVCYSATPPFTGAARSRYTYSCAGGYITFNYNQWSTITLYVPRESLTNYYFDKVWGEIDNIYAIDEMKNETFTESTESSENETTYSVSSVNSINNDVITDNVWYSINGAKVNKPTNGIYIKNGKKYVIK